jgi:hypothetical protein
MLTYNKQIYFNFWFSLSSEKITVNALRLCVRAGLPLHLIRRTELKYTQKASSEARNPA